jgi:hypothetical protein
LPDDLKWKNELLRCGLPLESEATRLLVSKGLRVASDFKYVQAEHSRLESLSIDLHAKAFTPLSDPGRVTGALELIVECRQVHSGVCWLFLPEAESPAGPAAAVGNAIRVVDEFSLARIETPATAAFDAELPICCKGLEIDQATGRVDDGELGRLLAQLQYALPRLMVESMLLHFRDQTNPHVPFLFCPLLLTTARLLVADRELGVEHVKESSGLGELAAEVPYLVMVCSYGPDFQSHCRQQFAALEPLERNEELLMVETKRAAVCADQQELPVATIESLIAADPYRLQTLFTRFVVCTASRLSELVDRIQQAAESAVESRQELQ